MPLPVDLQEVGSTRMRCTPRRGPWKHLEAVPHPALTDLLGKAAMKADFSAIIFPEKV